MTLTELYTAWDAEKKRTLKQTSYSTYTVLLEKHILPRLGEKEAITGEEVEAFRQELLAAGISPKTTADCVGLLANICRYGAKQGLWPMPTWSTNRKAGNKKPEMRPLSVEEQKRLIAHIRKEPTPRNIAVYLALTTGVSSGELSTLRWQDINLNARVLHVRGMLLSYYDFDPDTQSKRWVASQDSATQARHIPLASAQITLLKAEVSKHLPENYIFSNSDKPVDVRMVRKYVAGLMRGLGIKDRQYRDLRNTFAIQCIETGCDVFTLTTLLGGSSIYHNVDQYGSFFKKEPRPAMERLMESLGE